MVPGFSALLHALLALACVGPALGGTYSRTDSVSGSGFLDAFSYEAIPDPTHGRVNYVDAGTARSQNLTFASGNSFVLRADSRTRLSPSGPGRNSVRLLSRKQYTTAVMVFDIRHMPEGCGTWPAVWTVGADWPNQGEVDILEGVNDQGTNQATLHTSAGCTMPNSRAETGTVVGNDCQGNNGCGVKFREGNSYGPSLNRNGGGWFAMERTNSFIKVWFFPRGGNVPSDVSSGASSVNTDNWGTPGAFFPNNSCSISNKFGPHNIVINLTFCGDFAGNSAVYGSSGCPSTCVDFVNNNPSAFTNAFFDFAGLRVYT
ncbi:CAZyme family GH16 [Agaricus bisporus var. burnettii]|uniref:CAZyme family GH16 n=1 Tax=Agaricus bisporus var. burnettii TaxID=192524 RepID=A0A8H7C7G8_AGABI|nr:CAZyme family GH16 [Agaricus bisporus var. burnettii]